MRYLPWKMLFHSISYLVLPMLNSASNPAGPWARPLPVPDAVCPGWARKLQHNISEHYPLSVKGRASNHSVHFQDGRGQASHLTGFTAVNIDHDDYILMWFPAGADTASYVMISTSDHRFTYTYAPVAGDEDDPSVEVTVFCDEDRCLVIHTLSM